MHVYLAHRCTWMQQNFDHLYFFQPMTSPWTVLLSCEWLRFCCSIIIPLYVGVNGRNLNSLGFRVMQACHDFQSPMLNQMENQITDCPHPCLSDRVDEYAFKCDVREEMSPLWWSEKLQIMSFKEWVDETSVRSPDTACYCLISVHAHLFLYFEVVLVKVDLIKLLIFCFLLYT